MITQKLLPVAVLLLLSGCVTKGYVHQLVDPLSCRVEVLETNSATLQQASQALEARISALEARVNEAQLANKAMLDEATAKAAENAQRAEAASSAATLAAQKVEKLFELGQKK